MPIITPRELIDLVIMVAAVGYIFMDVFRRPIKADYDPLEHFNKSPKWENFKFAILVTAPAIVLHEAMHKAVALSFGIPAVFHAHLQFLGLGIILKLISFPFIFFVPGYVSIHGSATALQSFLISFAGPGTNLVLFMAAYLLIRNGLLKKHTHALQLTKRINLFLFGFNMLPIPPFDGFSVFRSLWVLLGF